MLKNINSKRTLNIDLIELKSFKEKTKGLIGSKNKSFIFKTRFGIHTFFLKSPIEIIILDKDKKVVKIKEDLKPFRIFLWNPKYFLVLELPTGSIKNLNIKLNNILDFNL